MRYTIPTVILTAVLLAACTPLAPLPEASAIPTSTTTVTVEKVTDGDTIRVWADGHTEPQRIRILGLDTPEVDRYGQPGECFGDEAGWFAQDVMPVGTVVTLTADPSQQDTDRYGRWLRYVTLPDNTDYSTTAIRNGFGFYAEYDGELTRTDELVAAENDAYESGAGLWQACTA